MRGVDRKTYSKRSSLGPFLSAGLGPLASVLLVGAAVVASVVSSSTKLVPRVILTRLATHQTVRLNEVSPATSGRGDMQYSWWRRKKIEE